VFTTRTGIEGIAGGKLTLGADASVATGPVGRQGSAATDAMFNAEIYSYARTRGLFGGIALDGSVIAIDRSANASFYGKSGVTASDIFAGQAPVAPPTAQRFLERLSQATHSSMRSSTPPPNVPAAAAPANAAAPVAEAPRTYPLEEQK
jgi:lipid-binding SYLF domain-containing protein